METRMDGALIIGNMAEVMPTLEAGSFDAILTDPPYGRKWLPLYESLLAESGRLLKPQGHLLAILPHYAMPEIFTMPSPGLKYRWMLDMDQRRGPWPRLCNAKRNIAVTWKPIGWWTVDPWVGADYKQIVDGFDNPAPEKDAYEWQQAEAWAEYCLSWCPEGGRVLDPFFGVGTLGIVAKRMGIECVGIELDRERALLAEERVNAAPDKPSTLTDK